SNYAINTAVAEELIPVKDLGMQSEFAKLAKVDKLSSRQVRVLVENYLDNECKSSCDLAYTDSDEAKNRQSEDISDIDKRTQRTFDKAIVTFRTAMSKMVDLTESVEDNWVLFEIFMHHKNILHSQIDLLIKEKKKI
ncbi:MAG: hypothetical protein ACRD8Z_00445, partial [Nitrososphaeraceae archaeon]